MPTYLYGVLPAGSDPPPAGLGGVGGAGVRSVGRGALCAWVETVDDRAITPTLERVRNHDAVLGAALAAGTTPLPARFGQTFGSDEECMDALQSAEARLVADLERVRGMVEMRVLIPLAVAGPASIPAGDTAPGTAYMQRLMERRSLEARLHAAASAIRDEVATLVRPLAREDAFVLGPAPSHVLTLSHLIARDEVASYRAALAEARLDATAKRLVISGPVAPYQFVSPPA